MTISHLIATLQKATFSMPRPAAELIIQKYGKDPFLILISCILSLRTTDAISYAASIRLFELARNPQQMVAISEEKIAACIFPVGFYRKKAYTIRHISFVLLKQCEQTVVLKSGQLLALPGVGRKTANLVLGYAYNIPAICVDTHVQRISNRLGLVQTKNPAETEEALKKIIPKKHWIELNSLLVMWGQNICRPQSPKCSECPLATFCPKIGVTKSR
ncbi:endonuclease III [Candidatus Dependentiae bacterium]|nr:MAG: endonuclease III [Candidatus Dependentiae bacterium]